MATRMSRPAPKFRFSELRTKFLNYLQTKDRVAALNKLLEGNDGLRTYLNGVVDENGYTDDKGNIFLDLDQPVEFNGTKFTALKRERRTSQGFDPEVAEKILKKKGLWTEPYIEMVPVIDQEQLRVLALEKKITQAELARCFPTSYNFALYPVKG